MLSIESNVSADLRLVDVRPYRAGEFDCYVLAEFRGFCRSYSEYRSHLKPAKSVQTLPIKLEGCIVI